MRKVILLMIVILSACVPRPSSSPAGEIIDLYPTMLPTPTLALQTRSIGEDEVQEAYHFFYELKNLVALGEYEHFAEEVRYPIAASVEGRPRTYIFVAELEADFEKIFDEDAILRFVSTDESELTFTENGVKVADGMIWFDLICLDPACEEAEFLIIEINN